MDVRRPGISGVLVSLALTAIFAGGCDSPEEGQSAPETTASAAPEAANPASAAPPKVLPEDPNAIVVGSDFRVFGQACQLTENTPIGAQGTQSLYTCSDYDFSVSEIRGSEATEAWKNLKKRQDYEPAKEISKTALLSKGMDVAVYIESGEDATYVRVEMARGDKPVEDSDLIELGKRIAAQIKAQRR